MPGRGGAIVRGVSGWASILFARLTQVLPRGVNRAVAGVAARLVYLFVPRVRKVGFANLDLAYGDSLTPAEKARILKGAVRNVALVAVEFMQIPRLARRGFARQVRIEGFEHVDQSRGVLFIAGHLGNWEWMAPALAAAGHRVAEVVRPLDHAPLNALVDAARRSGSIETIPKDDAGRRLLQRAGEGWIVGLLIDQSPRDNAVPVTFFGQPCWATIGAAMLAMRGNLPVHMVGMIRQPDGSYVLRIHPALEVVRTGELRADLVENTQRCQDAFEAIVREHPEQWLWFHRRWKPRPRLEREWQERLQRKRDSGEASA